MEARYKPRVTQIETLDKEIAAIAQNLQTNAGKLTAQAEADLNAQGPRSSATYSACATICRPMSTATATKFCRRPQ